MVVRIDESWRQRLQGEFDAPYFSSLTDFVRGEYASRVCFPPGRMIFRAFDLCRFEDVRVVILGQDPYHEPGQAQGLCFSVPDGVKMPPSLQNIFREIESDLGVVPLQSPDLSRWARQGVLLLNATLTVREHAAGSHQNKGWEQFTDACINVLNRERTGLVFILWGSYAQSKARLIDPKQHLILSSVHPSPLSAHRGFFGNHHFSRANAYLQQQGKQPIDWR